MEERYCYAEITLTLRLNTYILNPILIPIEQQRTPKGLTKSKLHEKHHRDAFENAFNTFKGYLEPYLDKKYPLDGKALNNELVDVIKKINKEWKEIRENEANHQGERWITWFDEHGKDPIW